MGRINRRIYATRRKRSPNKQRLQAGQGSIHDGTESWRKGAGPQSNKVGQEVGFPPYLSEESEEGVGGGKTYTIKEVEK